MVWKIDARIVITTRIISVPELLEPLQELEVVLHLAAHQHLDGYRFVYLVLLESGLQDLEVVHVLVLLLCGHLDLPVRGVISSSILNRGFPLRLAFIKGTSSTVADQPSVRESARDMLAIDGIYDLAVDGACWSNHEAKAAATLASQGQTSSTLLDFSIAELEQLKRLKKKEAAIKSDPNLCKQAERTLFIQLSSSARDSPIA